LVHTVWSTSDGVTVGLGEVEEEAALVLGALLDTDEGVGEEDSGRDAAAFFGCTVTEQPASAAATTTATVAAATRTAPVRPAEVCPAMDFPAMDFPAMDCPAVLCPAIGCPATFPSPFCSPARREPIRSMRPESIHDHRLVKQARELRSGLASTGQMRGVVEQAHRAAAIGITSHDRQRGR